MQWNSSGDIRNDISRQIDKGKHVYSAKGIAGAKHVLVAVELFLPSLEARRAEIESVRRQTIRYGDTDRLQARESLPIPHSDANECADGRLLPRENRI